MIRVPSGAEEPPSIKRQQQKITATTTRVNVNIGVTIRKMRRVGHVDVSKDLSSMRTKEPVQKTSLLRGTHRSLPITVEKVLAQLMATQIQTGTSKAVRTRKPSKTLG